MIHIHQQYCVVGKKIFYIVWSEPLSFEPQWGVKRTKQQLGVNNDQTATKCKHNTLTNENTTTNYVTSNYCTTRANQNMTIKKEQRGGWWTWFSYATRKTNTSGEPKYNKLCRRQLLHNRGEPKHDDQEATKRTTVNLMMLGYKEDKH